MPSSTLLSSSEPTLKSGLRSVLHSLDLSLEDELVRYRRARRDQERMAGSGSVGGRPDVGMTIAGGVSAGGVVSAGAVTGLEGLGLPLTGLGAAGVETVDRTMDRVADRTVDRTVELAQVTLQTMAQVPTMLPKAPAPIPVVTEVPQRVAPVSVAPVSVAPVSVAPAVAGLPQVDAAAPSVTPGAAASEGMSSAAGLVYVGEGEEPQAAGAGMVPPEGDPSQEGYFSSSAALLDSLAEEPVETGKTAWGAIVTPTSLGVGLLLMLVSAAFGYFVLHPSALRHVPIAKLWMKEQPVVRRDAETGAIADPTPGVEPRESGGVVNANPPAGPNLASKEFVDLNLGNLSGLNPQQPSIPQASLPPAAMQNAGQNAGQNTASVAIGPMLPTPGVAPGAPGASQVPLVGPGAAPGVVVGGNAPRPGLLSNLASAVAGNAALRQMNSGAPLPSVIPVPAQPGAPLPASLPAITPIGPQLPAPPAAAPVAAQQAAAPQPAPPAARPAARAAAPQPKPAVPAARPASPRAAAPRVAPAQPVTLPPAPQIQSAPPVNVPVNAPVSAPVTAPEPAQPETPPESFGSRFTVLVPYSGEASLAQVKQLIPDAYVRETVQGPRIQVGIFNEAGSAQALLEFLRGQGLAGEVGRTE